MAQIRALEPKLANTLEYNQLPLTQRIDAGVRQLWVKQGFVVRTRTDYCAGAPDPLHSGFSVTLSAGAMARCNPLRTRAGCVIER